LLIEIVDIGVVALVAPISLAVPRYPGHSEILP
jgi:hypothetical protein